MFYFSLLFPLVLVLLLSSFFFPLLLGVGRSKKDMLIHRRKSLCYFSAYKEWCIYVHKHLVMLFIKWEVCYYIRKEKNKWPKKSYPSSHGPWRFNFITYSWCVGLTPFLDFLWTFTLMLGDCWLCSSIGEESLCREVFEQYISQLKEQAKEHERKRKEEKVF